MIYSFHLKIVVFFLSFSSYFLSYLCVSVFIFVYYFLLTLKTCECSRKDRVLFFVINTKRLRVSVVISCSFNFTKLIFNIFSLLSHNALNNFVRKNRIKDRILHTFLLQNICINHNIINIHFS